MMPSGGCKETEPAQAESGEIPDYSQMTVGDFMAVMKGLGKGGKPMSYPYNPKGGGKGKGIGGGIGKGA